MELAPSKAEESKRILGRVETRRAGGKKGEMMENEAEGLGGGGRI